MDGVVIDTEDLYYKAEISFFLKHGINIENIEWNKIHGSSEIDFYKYCINDLNMQGSIEQLKNECHYFIKKQFHNNLNFNKGFKTFYNTIPKNINCGLVTSTSRILFNIIDVNLNLSNLFDIIVCGDDTKRNKPKPDPYLFAMKSLSIDPSKTIIIEDSIIGLRAAKSSGAFAIGLIGTFAEADLDADLIVNDFDEININYL
tara:strand:+ start:241 stop:846 length:606 start_codon:yes stop_codon:yes gene_type:complete